MRHRNGKKTKIKQPGYDKGNLGVSLSSATPQKTFDYPIFCLKHLINGYTLQECSKELKSSFATKLYMMAQQTWTDLETKDHKSGGFEGIPREQIKAKLPDIVTEDVSKLHVMRFNGKTGRIIGLRSDHILHITHIEIDKSAYNHGN